jgi:hypothetical protein
MSARYNGGAMRHRPAARIYAPPPHPPIISNIFIDRMNN